MRCDGGMSRAMLWKPAALAASAVLLTLAAACGGGDGDAQVRGADGGGAGYAAITVGDETWELDGLLCWFHDGVDPDASTLAFVGESFGTHDGVALWLDVIIWDDTGEGRLEGDGVRYEIVLEDSDDYDDPAVAWEADSEVGGGALAVDGRRVTGEMVFVDFRPGADSEGIPGSLDAVCD
jgi:hypothetical protein